MTHSIWNAPAIIAKTQEARERESGLPEVGTMVVGFCQDAIVAHVCSGAAVAFAIDEGLSFTVWHRHEWTYATDEQMQRAFEENTDGA